jgi:hypothetical protein
MKDLVATARGKKVRWQLVVCGPRNAAFDAFTLSLPQNPDGFNVLLVDSEPVVETTPWVHLYTRDHWSPGGTTDDHCHLMSQAMESGLIADIEAPASAYGENFYRHSFAGTPNVALTPKASLEPSLRAATRNTQKGEYQKIHHGSKLLAIMDSAKVRAVSHHCDRLFAVLTSQMS